MAHVVRDKNGTVISVLADAAEQKSGHLNLSDEEVDDLFGKDEAAKQLQEVLVASDLSFVRVLEDLIGVLMDRGVIMLTDLPEAAQEKLLQRRHIRDHLTNLSGLIDDGDEEDLLPI